jgi:hypothetical protein
MTTNLPLGSIPGGVSSGGTEEQEGDILVILVNERLVDYELIVNSNLVLPILNRGLDFPDLKSEDVLVVLGRVW